MSLMENHHRLWHRLVSRLRGRTSSFNFSTQPQRCERPLQRSIAVSDMPSRYAFYPLSSDHGSFYPFQERYFFNMGDISFTPKLLSHVTPRCLTEINAQDILLGRGTFDDFSPNCWLENHLHRFGVAPRASERDNHTQPHVDNTQGPTISSALGSSTSLNPDANSTRQLSNLFTDPSVHSSSDSSNWDCVRDSYSGSRDTTISDITHFYNSMAVTGFSVDVDPILPEPPPYSEFPDDPPPPYTEFVTLRPDRAQSSLPRQTSTMFSSSEILW